MMFEDREKGGRGLKQVNMENVKVLTILNVRRNLRIRVLRNLKQRI